MFSSGCVFLPDLYTPMRFISFIPYPKNGPITFLKGPRGRSANAPRYTNQARPRRHPGVTVLSSIRFFQKTPALVYTCKFFSLARLVLTFLKSGSGLVFILKNLQLNPLSYYFYNIHKIIPAVASAYATKQLLFLRVGSRVVNLRDVFLVRVLFATAMGSFALLRFFDRWSGFLTVVLPSGALRLFFFLSRADLLLKKGRATHSGSSTLSRPSRINWARAGTLKLTGRRPRVRGVARNPVDHPHGGRTKAIRFQRTPWGKPAKLK
uniref:ribosomal protein L2 n=1 Tax=Euplotes cristatus TaxID=756077 RepID=UPI002E79F217|nr:ribosomal protein L2 [Euplotes cristatus]UPM52071.1 ribosomal protein L2 [Euplotes cristatus]